MDAQILFPQMAGFPAAVSDVADAARDLTALRLVSQARNLPLLRQLPKLERLWCFDLNAKSAPIVGALSGLLRLYVDGIRLAELGPFAGLTRLEVLSLEGCTRVESLRELAPFRGVQALGVTHFPKVRSLEPLTDFDSLQALVVAGAIWTRMKVESLAPLARLSRLRHLHLTNLKALDESLDPLAALTGLETLELANFYPVEEFARLSARLKNTTCAWFAPFLPFRSVACPKCGQRKMVVLTGKGMPALCMSCDEKRVRKHKDRFRDACP
jgi:hypothetical protein